MIDPTLARFIVVGIGNTALGLAVIYMGRQLMDDFSANLVAYLLVVPVSFLTHRGWSFRDNGHIPTTLLRYLANVILGYGANLAVLSACLALAVDPYISQAVAIAIYVATTYLLSRYVVFLNPR